MPLSVLSYGGGVQSTALLVMAAQGEIHIDAALFANVGDDSEDPDTLTYVRTVAQPFGQRHGLDVVELGRKDRQGQTRTLYAELMRPESRSLSIPVRMANGAPGRRRCTADYKLKVVGKWARGHGSSAKTPATVLVGISWDEAHRLSTKHAEPWERPSYPLIERRMTREDCKAVIVRAGLPVPGKSSCYFCPFRKPSDFARMRRDRPELFAKAAALETTLNARRARLGKDAVYLTRFARPIADVVAGAQPEMDFGTGPGETCDEGYCWT
jgi:hypothetical protein